MRGGAAVGSCVVDGGCAVITDVVIIDIVVIAVYDIAWRC